MTELDLVSHGHKGDLAKFGQCLLLPTPTNPAVAHLQPTALTAACRPTAAGSCHWQNRPCGQGWRRH